MGGAVGEERVVEDGAGSVFVKFCWGVIRHAWSLVPKSAPGLVAASILHDGGMPPLP